MLSFNKQILNNLLMLFSYMIRFCHGHSFVIKKKKTHITWAITLDVSTQTFGRQTIATLLFSSYYVFEYKTLQFKSLVHLVKKIGQGLFTFNGQLVVSCLLFKVSVFNNIIKLKKNLYKFIFVGLHWYKISIWFIFIGLNFKTFNV